MSPSSPRYLMYVPYAGVTNQLISIWHGSMIAKALNRTLLIPNLSPNVHVEVDGQQEPAPTRWSEFIDLKLYSRQTGLQLEELDDFLARRGIIEHKGQLRRRSGSKNMKRSVGTKPASSRNKHKKRWIQLESLVQEGQPIPKSSLETTNGATSEQEAQEPHHQRPAFVKHPVVEQCFSEAGYGMDRRVDMTGRRFMQRYAINSTLIPTPFLDPERDNNSIWARWRMDKVIERYQQPHYEEEEILCLGHVYRLLPGGNNRAWVEFGQHFHFTEKVHEFVDEILEELLPRGHQAFVGIHLRRGDFERHCMGITSPADPNGWNRCYPSVQHIISLLSGKTGGGHSVSGVTAAAHAVALASGYQKLPVLVLTNERDPIELAKADAENWIRVDHKRLGTLERFGRYGPILIDGALLARANLLVGVEYSTYFKTASKRAETWYNSQTIFVT
ncbi:hypothetical protein MVEG_06529 [Podila verticillata NRRL 6337]|nr:hypothetical protein MVEG_06529 [Podila verticillata NRRL 6337]